ncbi:MAG TPA: glycosyltransferase [Saprospiraceae bacterium]|jgi:glycosyltransferase involved in cell wall biosynthesis|nr:glycosyltransferase [Saprospiraceae bacterium]HRO07438.1 glycosyltransferase [Saprospiraceae bacterium]HRP40721.1 glycosyltransferase [Saprospiraceae bacterium]
MSSAILYNYQKWTSFIEGDVVILESEYPVILSDFDPKSKLQHITCFFKQVYTLLKNWKQYQVIITQISGYHAFIPSLLSLMKLKKHIILLHGTDCNIIYKINYGNLGKPMLGWFTKKSMQWASLLLPVSNSLVHNTSTYLDEDECSLGLSKNIPNLTTPIVILANGIRTEQFVITQTERPPKSFLTVALHLEKERNFILKGIDLIIDLAKLNPDYTFTILGSGTLYNYNNTLPNVHIINKVPHNDLPDYYNRHRYYLQLSMSESFGLALCESMLCGCIPIVSDTGIMPEIVQDYGYILKKKDVATLNSMIIKAIEQPQSAVPDMMKKMHDSVSERFDMRLRKTNLLNIVQKIMN